MAHNHSTMNQPGVEIVSSGLITHSCKMNCASTERLAVSRKSVLRVTPIHNGTMALDATAKVLLPHLGGSGRLDGTPPELVSLHTPHFSVLRI